MFSAYCGYEKNFYNHTLHLNIRIHADRRVRLRKRSKRYPKPRTPTPRAYARGTATAAPCGTGGKNVGGNRSRFYGRSGMSRMSGLPRYSRTAGGRNAYRRQRRYAKTYSARILAEAAPQRTRQKAEAYARTLSSTSRLRNKEPQYFDCGSLFLISSFFLKRQPRSP